METNSDHPKKGGSLILSGPNARPLRLVWWIRIGKPSHLIDHTDPFVSRLQWFSSIKFDRSLGDGLPERTVRKWGETVLITKYNKAATKSHSHFIQRNYVWTHTTWTKSTKEHFMVNFTGTHAVCRTGSFGGTCVLVPNYVIKPLHPLGQSCLHRNQLEPFRRLTVFATEWTAICNQ